MRSFLKLLKSEELWVVFIIVFSVGLTISLFLNEVSQGKNLSLGRFQTFEHNFLPDFNAYLSKMTQGGKGEWVVHERFTAEPHEGSLLQIFYLLLGKITIGLMGLRADLAYQLARFVLAVVRLGSAYYFILAVFRGKEKKVLRLAAFLLFIFAGNLPLKITNPAEFGIFIGGDKFRMLFDTWSNLDPLQRLSYLPHWMMGQTILMLGLGMIIRGKNAVLIGLIGMIGGFVLPSVPLIIIPVWFVMTVFSRKKILGFLIGAVFMAVPIIYIKWVTGFMPWSALADSDRGVIMTFPWEGYIKALGVLGIGMIAFFIKFFCWFANIFLQCSLPPRFSIGMGSGCALKKTFAAPKENLMGPLVTVLWVVTVFGSLWFFDTFLHYDQRRFIQVGVELPLAILTVYLLGRVKNYLLIIIVGVLLIPSIFVWYISYQGRMTFVRDRINASYPLVSYTPYVVYQPRDWMEAIFWLSKNTTPDDVVFCDYVAGNYIAAYAGNRVYVGHGGQTVNYLQKLTLVKSFYSGKMTEKDARLFLVNNYAKYVFAGPQEMDYGGGFLKYKFLKPVVKGKTTSIYKINNIQ